MMGINYQPQLVSRISEPSTVSPSLVQKWVHLSGQTSTNGPMRYDENSEAFWHRVGLPDRADKLGTPSQESDSHGNSVPTWRIIRVSEWLITMVISLDMAQMAYKWGLGTTY